MATTVISSPIIDTITSRELNRCENARVALPCAPNQRATRPMYDHNGLWTSLRYQLPDSTIIFEVQANPTTATTKIVTPIAYDPASLYAGGPPYHDVVVEAPMRIGPIDLRIGSRHTFPYPVPRYEKSRERFAFENRVLPYGSYFRTKFTTPSSLPSSRRRCPEAEYCSISVYVRSDLGRNSSPM